MGAGGGRGATTGPTSMNCSKTGTKRYVRNHAKGIVPALRLVEVAVHDSQMPETALDAVPPIRKRLRLARKRPIVASADRA